MKEDKEAQIYERIYTRCGNSASALLQGLGTTAAISVLSILIAIVLGSAVGYMCLSKNKAVELIARAFIKIFRCTPFMVQVYLAYYGLPALGLNVSAFSTGSYNSWNVTRGLYRSYP